MGEKQKELKEKDKLMKEREQQAKITEAELFGAEKKLDHLKHKFKKWVKGHPKHDLAKAFVDGGGHKIQEEHRHEQVPFQNR